MRASPDFAFSLRQALNSVTYMTSFALKYTLTGSLLLSLLIYLYSKLHYLSLELLL